MILINLRIRKPEIEVDKEKRIACGQTCFLTNLPTNICLLYNIAMIFYFENNLRRNIYQFITC